MPRPGERWGAFVLKAQDAFSERALCDQQSIGGTAQCGRGRRGVWRQSHEGATASPRLKAAEGPDGREWGGTNGLWGQGDGCTNAGTCLGVTEPPWKSQELEESQPAVEQGVMLSEARCLEIPQRARTELAETWSGAQRGWQWEVRR